jgi:hypothetical protein
VADPGDFCPNLALYPGLNLMLILLVKILPLIMVPILFYRTVPVLYLHNTGTLVIEGHLRRLNLADPNLDPQYCEKIPLRVTKWNSKDYQYCSNIFLSLLKG